MQQAVENLELDQLPSLPEILLRILREFGSENLQVRELAHLIERDSALTLKILAVANSAACRRQQRIGSIQHCVDLLGFRAVKLITVSASTQQFLSTLSGIVPTSLADYWRHSQTTAFLSQAIAEAIGYPSPEEAYIAGLLHDIGKLALLVMRPAAYQALFTFGGQDDDHLKQELGMLGIGHGEIGAMLARHWGLEPLIVDAIRHHHESPLRIGKAAELVKAVALANLLARMDETAPAPEHPSLAIARALFDIEPAAALKMRAEAGARTAALSIELGVQFHDRKSVEHPKKNGQAATDERSYEPRRRLAEEVRAATLLDVVRDAGNAAASEEQLLAGTVHAAAILFEPRQIFLFEWNAASNLITGKPFAVDQESLARLRFPLQTEQSMIADALLANTVTSSCRPVEYDEQFVLRPALGEAPCMVDQQIIGLANAECIYCAPLATRSFMYGVLVLAFGLGAVERIDRKRDFLKQFARQAAASLEQLRREPRERATGNAVATAEDYRTHARKVIHEASNPLSILKNYLKLLDLKLKAGQPAELEINILNEEIDRVASIIRRLAAAPADSAMPPGAVNVNAVIRDMAALCQPSIFSPGRIQLETHLDDQLPPARTDASGLKQVLLNLFKNAAEAMPTGGRLTLTTAARVDPQQRRSLSITIQDSGPGISQAILPHLFSPVTSTKGEHNSGLGLTIVAEIVGKLGGVISCKSASRTGTCFEITLPLGSDTSST